MRGAERIRRLGRYFLMADHLLVVAGFYLVFPVIGLHFVDRMGWAAAAVGLALGIRQVSQQGLALLGGSLSDRFGVKPLIVGGMLLRAAGFAMMALAHTPLLLVSSCILSGLGGALFEPARGALVAKLTRPAQRSRFYALLVTQESAASVLGALLGTLLLGFDFQWVALGGAAIFLVTALLNAWLLPAFHTAVPGTSALAAMQVPLRDKPFMLLVLTLSGYYVMVVQIMLLIPVHIAALAGTPKAATWIYTINAALALLLAYPLARLGERWLSLEARLLLGIGIMSSGLLAVATTSNVYAVLCCVAVFFIGFLVAEPAREALVARFAKPEARASYFGLSRMGLAIGGLLGYFAGGYLLDRGRILGASALPWYVLAAIGTATYACLWWQLSAGRQAGRRAQTEV